MYLDCAVFENYRNIEHFTFSFARGINILYGKNAQGKTNVIEGIYLFGSGKSFRHAREKDLIKADCNFSGVSICYVDDTRENKMSMRFYREMTREMFQNSVKIGRLSHFIGHFRTVLFCPEHLSLVKDEPSERRGFLDNAISQINIRYLSALMDQRKLLEQRNALLKNAGESGESFSLTMEILSDKLARCAADITAVRAAFLRRLFFLVDAYLQDMTGNKEHVSYRYLTSISREDEDSLFDAEDNYVRYQEVMKKNLSREILIGSTIGGAHRDDFEILLNGKNAKIFASQGQQRSIALSMKLAEGEISKQESGEYPVFLLDDVLSELDRERKDYVLSALENRQVILTTCDESDFTGIPNTTKIRVDNGNYFYM